MGFSTIFDGASLSMIVPVSDKILSNKKIILPENVPGFVKHWVDVINSFDAQTLLYWVSIAVIFIFLFKGIFLFLQGYLMNLISQRSVRDVRNNIYAKLQMLSLDFYSQKRAGELVSRITNDANLIGNALSYGLTDLIYQTMQVILFAAIVFFINYKLAFLTLVIFPCIIYPIIRVGKKLRKISYSTQEKMADLNTVLSETISGVRVVKGFCREDYEVGRFSKINNDYCRYMMKSIKRMLILNPSTEFIGVVAGVFIFVFGGREVIEGHLSFGVFGLFLGSLMSMIRPFKKLSQVHSINQQTIAASERIYQILELEPQIKDVPGAVEINSLQRNIVFEDVWFKYEKNEDFVIKGVNLEVRLGETIAIVGTSGAGKSTLINLIPRFYDPTKGKICFDGVDIKTAKLSSLRNLMGIVTQDIVLFNDTVRANIAYGNLEASDQQIEQAAALALADDFIQELPNKYNTIIGDRGFRLSGGQKQRICIARAILKNPAILILDEATSQLDSQSEQIVQKALENLTVGRTVFVIAHRFSTIINASKIIVLSQGKIVDFGSHQELLAKSQVYQQLSKMQRM